MSFTPALRLTDLIASVGCRIFVFDHPRDPRAEPIQFLTSEWTNIEKFIREAAERAPEHVLRFHHYEGNVVAIGPCDPLRVALSVVKLRPLRLVEGDDAVYVHSARFAEDGVVLKIRHHHKPELEDIRLEDARAWRSRKHLELALEGEGCG